MLNKKNMINIYFYTMVNSKLKEISVTIKKARGLFVRYMAINHINDIENLKLFNRIDVLLLFEGSFVGEN